MTTVKLIKVMITETVTISVTVTIVVADTVTILIAVTETIRVTTTVTITIRDCAMIIRRRRPKNESRKEKYYTIPPLSTKAN